MADRVKRTWRGRTYWAQSTRPGKKRVHVKGHCRRKPKSIAHRVLNGYERGEMPF